MAQYALKSGNLPSYNLANAETEQQANFDVSPNPLFKNELTRQESVVCYEIRNDNSTPNNSQTNGVSRTDSGLSFLNRKYPNTTTVADHLENQEKTQGHRIQCYDVRTGLGQTLASDFLDTYDYFVCIFADDYKSHHFAKITLVTTEELAGDSFTFLPAYNGELPKGTKFTIWEGPETTDTAVVAVGYGLQGSGDASDERHDIHAVCAKPNFFFYDENWDSTNSRLENNGRLNHDTKHQMYYSRKYETGDGNNTHATVCFVTEQEYGMQAIDYGKFGMNARLVDNLRTADTPTAVSTPQGYEKYGSTSVAAFNYDFADWGVCFPNIRRDSGNLTKAGGGGFGGPSRYIHYTKSPDKTNVIPRMLESNVFDSVTKTGTYAEARLADPHKIMGKKIQKFDKYRVKETIAEGRIEFAKNKELHGKWTSASTYIKVSELETGHSLDTLLFNATTSAYEEILIGDYHYRLGAHNLTYLDSDGKLAQNWTISAHRLKTAATFTTTTTLPVSFTDSTAYRRAWSKVTNTLIVDFPIAANFNSDKSELLKNGTFVGTLVDGNYTDVYGLEIVLTGGNFTGITLQVNAGEKVNSFINFQNQNKAIFLNYKAIGEFADTSMQMYQKLSLGYPNILDYFQGAYTVNKVTFKGSIENIEEYVEDGQHKFYISGRSDVSKLLGPVVNKNYSFSDDWIYSTILPYNNLTDSGANTSGSVIQIGATTLTYSGTLSSNVVVGDFLFAVSANNTAPLFIGRIHAINTGTSTITFEEGSLTSILTSKDIYYVSGNSGNKNIALAKAIGTNSSLSSKTTSLDGALNKGIIFNSGKKITVLGADSTKLLGSSSSTHAKSKGYYIYKTARMLKGSTYTKDGGAAEESFMCKLTDGNVSPTYSHVDTVNSLSDYMVVASSRSEGNTIFTLAPVCPALLGRFDYNAADTRLLTTEKACTTVNNGGGYALDYYGTINCDTTDPLLYGYFYGYSGETNTPCYLYNSSKQLLGRIIKARWRNGTTGYTLATSAFAGGELILDRPLPVAIADDEVLYVAGSSTTALGEITSGLYLLNAQGLRNGGLIHAVNSGLSGGLNSGKPITFSVAEAAAGSYGINDYYGTQSVFRFLDLQKGDTTKENKGYGAFTYKKRKLADGSLVSHFNKSNVNAYATGVFGVNTTGGEHGVPRNPEFAGRSTNYGNLDYNQKLPQQRGIYPAHGSNFEDYEIYSSAAQYPIIQRLAQYDNTGDGGPWLLSASGTNDLAGFKDNAISQMRDALEVIDPNMIRWFIFAPGDIYPESMRRFNHIGYTTRDFTDYSLILKGKSAKESVAIGSVDNNHTHYSGSALSDKEIDSDYQAATISSASITPDEMRRVGIMRLKELTMDWHFNPVDTETTIDFTKGIEPFTPHRFLSLEKPDFYDGYTNNAIVTATSSYTTDGSKTVTLTSNTNYITGSSGTLAWTNGHRVYSNDGSYIGTVDSSTHSTITFDAEPNMVDGKYYCSANAGQDGIFYKMKYTGSSWATAYGTHGKSGESSVTPVGSFGTLPSNLSNYQSIFNNKDLINTQGVAFNGEYPNRKATPAYFAHLAIHNKLSYFGVNPLSTHSAGIQFPPMFGTERVTDSTVDYATTYAIGASTTITVKTVNATTKFKVGDEIYSPSGFVGILSAVASTTLTLTAKNAALITADENVYLGYKSMLSRTHIFFNSLEEQKGYTGSRVINSINPDIDESANLGVAAISMASGHTSHQGVKPPTASPPFSFGVTTGASGGSGFAATYRLTNAKSTIEFEEAGVSSDDSESTLNYLSTTSEKPYIDIHEIDLHQADPYKYTYRCYFDSPDFADATCDLTNGDATVTCDAAPIRNGMTLACGTSGFPGSATVASINAGTSGISVTSFEMSANFTGSTVANQTITFGRTTPSTPSPGTIMAIEIAPGDSANTIAENFNSTLRDNLQDPLALLETRGMKLSLESNILTIENVAGGAVGTSTNALGHVVASATLPDGSPFNDKNPKFGTIRWKQHGGNVIDATVTNSGLGYTSAPSINELAGTYKLTSSHSVGAVNYVAHVGTRTYSGMKAVVLDRYSLQNQLEYKADKGSAVDLGLCYQLEKHRANSYSHSSFMVATENNFKNGTVIKLPFAEKDISGRKYNNYDNESAISSIADGVNFVIKPLLHLDDSTVGLTTVHSYAHVKAGNGLATLRFDVSKGASEGNLWLRYAPNLTGCYLVSSDGYQYETTTLNDNDATDSEGTWDIDTAADVRKAASASPEGIYPRAIHYISSHQVTTSGSTQYHELIVDNWLVGTNNESLIFRVMQPAETCFWENTPNEIDMYKMSSKYTKMTNSNELYGEIGQWTIYENGPVTGVKSRYGYNEGIQSMYVFVDMDPKSGGSTGTTLSQHIVPRNHSPVVGSGKKFEVEKPYNMFLTDGITTTSKTFTFTDVATYSCKLKMGGGFLEGMEKMAGIVSAGETFTVTTNDEINIEDIEKAAIGTSVTVCPETEDVIDDLFKSHNLNYRDTDSVVFPYFTGIKIIGSDLYNSLNYLASLKDKTINIKPVGISLDKDDSTLNFTDIRISNDSNDVKILEMKKNQSMYDFYNEITVFGKNNKSTKRDRKSMDKIGKRTLERIDDNLLTQSEVDREAQRLLLIHAKVNNRITIKTINRGIELLKAGHIITVDLPHEGITTRHFMVLEIQYSAFGVVQLELGQYDKNLSDRLAELLMENKRVASVLRGDRYKIPNESLGFLASMKIRSLRLTAKKTTKTGSPFTIGFNYPIDVEATGGNAAYPIGFNTSIGSVDTTIIVDEDLA